MSVIETDDERDTATFPGQRPPRASVGSHRVEEEVFGKAYDPQTVRRIWAYVRPYRKKIYISVASVLVFTGSQLAIPLIIGNAIDSGMSAGGNTNNLISALVAFSIAILVNYVASYTQEKQVGDVAENVLFDMRRAMMAQLQRVSLSYMDKTEVGRLMSRLQGDVNSMQEFLETSIISVGDIVLLFGIVIVLLTLDPWLGLLTLVTMPILFVVRLFWLPPAKRAFWAAHETNSTTAGAMAEGINGVRTVQNLDRQRVNFDLYDDKAYANLRTQLTGSKYAQVMVPIVDSLTGISMATVIVVGGAMVLNGNLQVGVIVAFLFYIQRFFDPIRSLTMQYSIMQRAMTSGRRIMEVIDLPVVIDDKPDAKTLGADMDGSVEFRNVVFGYDPKRPVLKNVSFKVNPGETVALVGPTGSGKTSAMSLVHRFYEVQDGAVIVGGHDVRDVTQESLGAQVAMVLQEPFLFTGTIFENIRYNKLTATRDDVIAAAKAVGAHDFIARLPEAYDTPLEQRGSNFSLGQRQLLSFARALVADAKILVLDEATANIDSYTERQIQKALEILLKGRTGMVIAHRLATIRGADRIIVLQNGEKIEEGNHNQLMELGGLYSKLYNMNYASFDDIPDELVASANAKAAST
ncbi:MULTISPECIES: ABC transporter ATP-binding protein [unclassified Devosia]|uniref:ABC transporter ATP-binding protein n=1 Tax=unclassified Devosia TaxID=196773 RepID=UPI00145D5A4A|nr:MULTISPECIES: ABC transporter ATP-binding protein [unclassified Devosia]MBJ6988382.1 ABC transporter ATP-binding protein [Devosia sp. MC521]MBJ7579109.1 ABC transporter ATP-binding protein [Devosia sp. MC532]QMW63007.1 ABC transporter ATP-binding protein [Devosia sp. MC521]